MRHQFYFIEPFITQFLKMAIRKFEFEGRKFANFSSKFSPNVNGGIAGKLNTQFAISNDITVKINILISAFMKGIKIS